MKTLLVGKASMKSSLAKKLLGDWTQKEASAGTEQEGLGSLLIQDTRKYQATVRGLRQTIEER